MRNMTLRRHSKHADPDRLAVSDLTASHGTLLSGREVHFRTEQMIGWSVIAGVLGAGFVAGLYWLGTQQDYHNLLPFLPKGTSAKAWWDSGMGIVHSGNWSLYRHAAFRDLAEPAFAIMGISALLAKPKWWDVRVGTLRLVTSPFILIAMTFALGIAGVWLLDFALPGAWHHLFGSYVMPGTAWLGRISAGTLALGFIIGRVLHRFWAPVGATIQGDMLERSVRRAQKHHVPAWERLPLNAPVARERFAKMYRAAERAVFTDPERGWAVRLHAWSVTAIAGGGILVTAVGLIAKYYFARGGHLPYLNP